MPYFDYDGNIDIDVDEFLSSCTLNEIQEIIESLVEDEHILPSQIIHESQMSAPEQLFEKALTKLHGKWNQLTKSEEEILMAIAKRF